MLEKVDSFINIFINNLKVHRLVFSPSLDLCRNLVNVKEKPTRNNLFLALKETPGSTHLPFKISLVGISLMSAKFLLYIHEKLILKRKRVFEKSLITKAL